MTVPKIVSDQPTGKDVCLVLGGNGFIGSHIVDKLALDKTTEVRVLDVFAQPPQYNTTLPITTIKGSAFDVPTLQKALQGVSYVVHSLSATNPFTADKDPFADIDNLHSSIKIFEQCIQAGVKKIAFISSGGAVYGRIAEQKQVDEADMPMPVSPYGICKLATEHYLEYFHRKYGTEYVVYRLANPYGPRQAFKREQGVIAAFLHHILEDEEITIQGDGSASRDYVYIEDAATMIASTLRQPNKHPIYNIGSGTQTTLNEIIAAMEHIFSKQAPKKYIEAPRTTLQKTDISTGRFHAEFGDYVTTHFQEGLAKTLKQFAAADVPASSSR